MRPKCLAKKDGECVGVWLNESKNLVQVKGRCKQAVKLAEAIRTDLNKATSVTDWSSVLNRLTKMGCSVVPVKAFRRLVH
jgi:hypothetical protein